MGPAIGLPEVLASRMSINTQTLSRDRDGYVQFAPAIQGQYRNATAHFSVYPEWPIAGAYRLARGERLFSAITLHGARREWTGRDKTGLLHGTVALGLHLMAQMQMPASVSFAWQNQHWSLAWRGDPLQPSKARIWGLAAYGRL